MIVLAATHPLIRLLEMLGLSGILFLLHFIPWTKMTLGAGLTLAGAFWPRQRQSANPTHSEGQFEAKAKEWSLSARGSLRFLVVLSGMILIVGSVADGARNFLSYGSGPFQMVPLSPEDAKKHRAERIQEYRQKGYLPRDREPTEDEFHQAFLRSIDEL